MTTIKMQMRVIQFTQFTGAPFARPLLRQHGPKTLSFCAQLRIDARRWASSSSSSPSLAIGKGPELPPLCKETVGENFRKIVAKFGHRNAVISRHQNTVLTYRQLDRDSDRLAKGLENIGVKKGDRVSVNLGNNIEFATVTYALFKLGAILNPLNPAFLSHQIVAALKHLDSSYLIIGAETKLPFRKPTSNVEILESLAPDIHSASKIESEVVPSLRGIVVVDNSSGRVDLTALKAATTYAQVVESAGDQGRPSARELKPDEVVNIQFTSGTTSMPKAASLAHTSILNNGRYIGDRMLLTEHDAICCPPPLYHCFGSILGYMATATHGSAIVFPAESFDPMATMRAVQEYKCTGLYGVPTMFNACLDLLADGSFVPEQGGLSHLRTGIAAGTSVPIELMKKLHRELNLTDLTIAYGMTETSPVSFMTTTDDPLEKRVETVGRLLPNTRAKIVSATNRNQIMKRGESGELAVAGYLLMKEYWNDAEKTNEAMAIDEQGTRWMHTGDEGIMDEKGYMRITGRLKDIIIRGGENIHPLDVENALLSHPGVSDVSAVGVPDEKYGEVVAVFVIPRYKSDAPTDDEVKKWVRDRLGGHFVPRYCFSTDAFPKTASGKIQRFKLREEALQRLKELEGGDWGE